MIHFLQSQGFLLQKYLVHLWLESSLAPPFVGLKAFVVDLSFPSWHIPSALMATGRWNWQKRDLLSQSNPVLNLQAACFSCFSKPSWNGITYTSLGPPFPFIYAIWAQRASPTLCMIALVSTATFCMFALTPMSHMPMSVLSTRASAYTLTCF